VGAILIALGATGCGTPSASPTDTASSPGLPVKPVVAPTDRDNNGAKAVTLKLGAFVVGTDVQPGRYVITPGKGQVGHISISSANDPMIINEALGVDATNQVGVPSVTTDLSAGDAISISGLTSVDFKPTATTLSTKLTAGNWYVGLDISPGTYTATIADNQAGYLFVISSAGDITLQQVMGAALSAPTSASVTLNSGDLVKVMGLPAVTFS